MATPSIVGQWVTSFIAHFPVDATDFLPDFAGTKFRRPQTAWVPYPPGTSPPEEIITPWEAMWRDFKADEDNWNEVATAAVKHPAPQSVLASFTFRPNKEFDAHLEMNALTWFGAFDVAGTYTVQAETFGGYGGQIVVPNDDGTTHLRFRYLLINRDEMNFISTYLDEPHRYPPNPDKLLQTVAGTMRRMALH